MKIQVLLKSGKNNGYFTFRPIYIYDHIFRMADVVEKIQVSLKSDKNNGYFT